MEIPVSVDSALIILLSINALFVLLFTIFSIANSRRIRALRQKYNKFMELSGEGNIEKVLTDCVSCIQELKEENREIRAKINEIERRMLKCIQRVGIIRYNAFENVGSDLSFAAALLDANNDGLTLNGIYTREGSSVYAKPVTGGKSKYTLSAEETMALKDAMKAQG